MHANALLPRPAEGMGRGALLALLVHAGLIVALTLGVGWRVTAPEVVSAELWAALPQIAAPKAEETPQPRPMPTPPAPLPKEAPTPPRDAQIAIERAERRLREEKEQQAAKAELDKKKREADQEKKRHEAEAKKAEDARMAKLREDQMKRMQGSLAGSGAPTATGSAAQDAAPSQAYVGRLIARIKQNVVFSDQVAGNPAAEVEVRAAPSGTIIARRLVKSSGVPEWDDAVLRAIDRTGTLPRDTDGRVPPTLIVAFRPKE